MDLRFALLLACFFLSGFAALLYQTAWTRELSFVFGTSELAVAAVLAAYMGGLALGAAAAARLAPRLRRPVLAYGLLELAIALSALAVPLVIRGIAAAYFAVLGGRADLVGADTTALTLFQLGSAFAVLLPPTAFMGATLPLLARHAVRREREIGERVGVLYATNTAGAILGTLAVAFWLMPAIGLRQTVYVGAGLNGVVFVLAAWLSRAAPPPPEVGALPSEAAHVPAAPTGGAEGGGVGVGGDEGRDDGASPRARAWILPMMLVSGSISFSYEVVWTRLLGHLLGASLDAFATMLASFLLGIALGSAVAARFARDFVRSAQGFALVQLGVAVTAHAALFAADRLPELAGRLGAGPGAPLASAGVAIATLLPVTVCIGATFPLAVRMLATAPDQAASATARVYAWNTVGAIVGALGAGFVLLPELGFDGTVAAGVRTSALLAAATVWLAGLPRLRWLVAVAVVLAATFVVPVGPPWALLRASPLDHAPVRGEIRFSAVGRSATVVLTDDGEQLRLTTNGLPEARPQRKGLLSVAPVASWLGMLPAALRTDTRDMLVVGLGGASMIERVPGSVERIDVIELEPEVVAANQDIADVRDVDPLRDPRVRIQIGDARGLLQLTDRRYDGIVSQPSHPWTAGASHLYTREFFTLVRERLTDTGVFVQWIGLQYLDESLLRTLTATLTSVFDHVEIYQPRAARGILFVASQAPLADPATIARAIAAAPGDYAGLGIAGPEDVLAARVLDTQGTRALSEGATPNTDDHNLLAAHASRLGDSALDPDDFHALWQATDPLLRDTTGLDRGALVRALARAGFTRRATDVALTVDGAEQESELGWAELMRGRGPRAQRHFERALKLDPALEDARLGLVTLGLEPPPREPGAAEDPRVRALVDARAAAARGDWGAVAALDGELAAIDARHPLYDQATRLRVQALLDAGDAASADVALTLVESLLVRRWTPSDAVLRARAALAAGRPEDAWGACIRILKFEARRALTQRTYVGAVREVMAQLPEELRGDLERRMRGGAQAVELDPEDAI